MRNPLRIRILWADIHLLDLRTRIPFKYGIATMTEAPHAFVRVGVEINGKLSTGIAADLLPPKWFTKDPAKALDAEVAEMLEVIEHAVQVSVDVRAESVLDAWIQVYRMQAEWGRSRSLPPLLVNFGTALVERALIHAACRAFATCFGEAVDLNLLGIELGAIHSELSGLTTRGHLPARSLDRILGRHTVGLGDPLRDEDIVPADRLNDGLPHSFTDCIRAYGLRHFKIKVNGDLDRDLDRLRRVAAIITKLAPVEFAFSLDGNEQFRTLDQFRTFWEAILRSSDLSVFFQHLLFVEQPWHRDVALHPQAIVGLAEWRERPPLIIDESDAELDSLPRALELGYAGTSHKNCKGVFRSIANACLLEKRRRDRPGQQFIHSGEDLANIGPVALLQDLAVCAALGIESVERNGHHYFAGLSMFPPGVQQQILEHHGDLYRPSRDGWPTLAIRDGMLNVGSAVSAPFGVAAEIDVEQFTPLDTWRTNRSG